MDRLNNDGDDHLSPVRRVRFVGGRNFLIGSGVSLLLLTSVPASAPGQDSGFNVLLTINTASAERAVELYKGLGGHPDEIAQLRGSQIALATTAVLSRRPLDSSVLEKSLEAAKFNQDLGDDVFRMKSARAQVAAIGELLAEIPKRNFGQKVVSTVAQLFPPDTRISSTIPVYFVAFGPQTIDAFVQRVVWRGNTPAFVREGQGELSIVVNLAKAVNYGQDVDERFTGLMSVVAHEVFHAAFGVYKDLSPQWKQYYATNRSYFDQLLDLSQNEGVAYYLTLVQRSHGRLTNEWVRNLRTSFDLFNRRAEELLSRSVSGSRAQEIILESNTSEYWNSFGSIAGMTIARQIDQTRGRTALSETLAAGPNAFFKAYVELMKQDPSIPQLSDAVIRALSVR